MLNAAALFSAGGFAVGVVKPPQLYCGGSGGDCTPRPNVIAWSECAAAWISMSCTEVFGRFVPRRVQVVLFGLSAGLRRKKTPRSPETITVPSVVSSATPSSGAFGRLPLMFVQKTPP